ncbi:MAG: LysR family transcriptional regulator [Alphaproteobacteria bacterium]|nr:LysR family transcriptional regulator [Alphaproteobacteria bacterium]
MRRDLPPLTALRAFEAAARHGSFTRAAEELGVTQSAVSRQIRVLEDFLSMPLFRRFIRRLELTEAGRAYQAVAAAALDEIERATLRLKGRRQRRVLTISVLPTIAAFWLMPRLASFAQQVPDVELRIISSIEPVDLQARAVDAAIRVGALPGERFGADQPRIELQMLTDWRGARSEFLFPDILVPIASPALLAAGRPANVEALGRFRLIHVTTRRYAWHDWLRAHRAGFDPERDALHFGHFFMAMEAARAGRGIAIVPTVLLRHYDGASRIVRVFEPDVASAGAYHVLFHETRAGDPALQKLRSWLQQQAAADTPEPLAR